MEAKGSIKLTLVKKPSCVPCTMMLRNLEEHGGELHELGTEVEVADITEQPELAEKHGIMSVPVVLIEKDGELVERFNGLVDVENVISAVESAKGGD